MAYLGNSPVLSQQEYRNIDDISGSFNGVTTSFALLVNGVAPIPGPQTSNQCLISVNGVIQKPDDTGASGFRISGGNIVFSSAPTGGQTFFGVILAGADYIYAGENFPDGTVSAPTITFAQDLDTGFYRSGAGEVKFTANGVNTVTFSSNGLTAPNFIPSGSSVPTNGVYLPSANNVAIATNSTQRLLIDSSGQIEAVSLGSAAAPTWSFTTDTNTGIYSPGADQVAISTGGSGRLFVDANGNISIGQSSSALQSGGTGITVFGTTASEIKFLNSTTGASGTDGTALVATTSDFNINNREVGALVFGTSNSARLRIESTGALNFVGAGTAGSTQAVSFNGSAPVNSLVIDSSGRLGVGTSSPVSGAQLTVAGSALAVTGQNLDHSANSIRIGQEGSGAAQIRCYGPNTSTNGSLTFKMSRSDGTNSQDVVIDGSGRLGIGTSSPTSAKLDVRDDVNYPIRWGSTSAQFGELSYDTGNCVIGATSGNKLTLRSAGTAAITIDTSQRVGIGTATPSAKLEVSGGNIRLDNNQGVEWGGANNYIYGNESTDFIAIATNGNERARIDSSGRWLLGTSSSPSAGGGQYSLLTVQGYVGAPTGAAFFSLQRGETAANITTDEALGLISFNDSAGNQFAEIVGRADGNGGANDYPGRLVFSTTADGESSPTERMRINSNGIIQARNIAGDTLNLYNAVSAGSSSGFIYGVHSSSSVYTGTTSFIVYTNGNVVNTNGSYTTLSDAKLKENIVDAGSQWSDLKAIQIRNWNFKAETGHETHRQIGPIAQELETVCPGLVFETPDRDPEGNDLGTTTKGINQSVLYMKAVKALQEAMERIETLEQRLADAGIA